MTDDQLQLLERAFPLLFLLLWVFVSQLFAGRGGWRKLAQTYPDPGMLPDGEVLRFRSARFNGLSYTNSLFLRASSMGLRLSVLPLFRFGHPPILVPWQDLSCRIEKSWLLPTATLTCAGAPDIRITLSSHLARRLVQISGNRLSLQEPTTNGGDYIHPSHD